MMINERKPCWIVAGAALAGLCLVWAVWFFLSSKGGDGENGGASVSFTAVAERVSPSVVSVICTKVINVGQALDGSELWAPNANGETVQQKSRGFGSGFIIDSQGIIATNEHVVNSASTIVVRFQDGHEYPAKLLSADMTTDIALIRIHSAAPLEPVVLGNSDALRLGDWVMAIGNPYNFGHSVTVGVVSARDRVIENQPFEQYIQTDAAINLGNSGGPLFNSKGEVVGIATAISNRGGNIGFAIPINLAKRIIQQLEAGGRVVRGYLGIRAKPLSDDLSTLLQVPAGEGVVVEEVAADAGAAQAGLRRYDVITEMNGMSIKTQQDFYASIAQLAPKSQAQMKLIRDGKPMDVSVCVGERVVPSPPQYPSGGKREEKSPPNHGLPLWGLAVQDLPEKYKKTFLEGNGGAGVFISAIVPMSPAADADLSPGQIILEINRQPVRSLNDYQRLIRQYSQNQLLMLLVVHPHGGSSIVVLKRTPTN